MNKVKFTHKGEGHIEVKVKITTAFQILCSSYSWQLGGLHSTFNRICSGSPQLSAMLHPEASSVNSVYF